MTSTTQSPQAADLENARFYDTFPYPWPPASAQGAYESATEAALLRQATDWDTVPGWRPKRIWVAGCGTNQGVQVALRFPEAEVLATDVSERSLAAEAAQAAALNLTNLLLRRESVNEAAHRSRFDYIVCTGVAHHLHDPAAALQRLADALAPAGIIELMVYNVHHRRECAAVRELLALMGIGSVAGSDTIEQVRRVLRALPSAHLREHIPGGRDGPPEMLADALLQPVEHAFTVAELHQLVSGCGLALRAPVLSPFDQLAGRTTWSVNFECAETRALYEGLPDWKRWAVGNILLGARSPMLWFYLTAAADPALDERAMCDRFLEAAPRAVATTRRVFVRDGVSWRQVADAPHPGMHPDSRARQVVAAADGSRTVRLILEGLGLPTTFASVNELRLRTVTPSFPYLIDPRVLNSAR